MRSQRIVLLYFFRGSQVLVVVLCDLRILRCKRLCVHLLKLHQSSCNTQEKGSSSNSSTGSSSSCKSSNENTGAPQWMVDAQCGEH